MKALIVYESMFGNTKTVAAAIGSGLSLHMDVRLEPVDASVTVGDDIDLVVVGGPTHAFSMSRPQTRAEATSQGASMGTAATGIREWLAAQPHQSAGARIATFDTRMEKVRHLPGSAARRAAKAAGGLGYDLAARPESFYVIGTSGPLAAGELERAHIWGERLAATVGVTGHAKTPD